MASMAATALRAPATVAPRAAAVRSAGRPVRGWIIRNCNLAAGRADLSSHGKQRGRFGAPALPADAGRRRLNVQAVATPIDAPAATRAQLRVEDCPGFKQLGEPVPESVSMTDVLSSLPKNVFELNAWKAWSAVAITLTSVAAGLYALTIAPWYMLPFIYIYMSAAVTGFFVVGHDCGHNSFSSNQTVNDVVGTLMFMPLMFPFEPWRIKHNTHHAHTNKLVIDTAWQPWKPDQYMGGNSTYRNIIKLATGPLWWVASVGHWLLWHFDLKKFKPNQRPAVKVSLAAVTLFGLGVLVPLTVLAGPLALVKYWLMPWLGFHFWMSTFTLIHHTAPHIEWRGNAEWRAVSAQLGGTVHCEFPKWIDVLTHDISVHVGHHLSTKIPWYNLRPAYASLQKNWGKHLNIAEFGLPLMMTITQKCGLWDPAADAWRPIADVDKSMAKGSA